MECTRFGLSIDDYLDDGLDSDDRRAFRRHLQTCVQCRAEAISFEPSLMFAAGGPLETDDRAASECAEAVTALIRQDRLRRRLVPRSRRWLAAAAACVVVLGGGLLWRSSPWSVEKLPVEVAVSEEAAEEVAPPPRMEVEMPGSGVRLYQFAGAEDETTAVYFVVNEAMEL